MDDERVDGIAFTGASPPARGSPARGAAVARVNLELGGKDPFIVAPTDGRPRGRGRAWRGPRFLNAGQVCTSAERFYVQREGLRRVLDAFVAYTRTLTSATRWIPSTDIGPMVSAATATRSRPGRRGAARRGRRCWSAARRRPTTVASSTSRRCVTDVVRGDRSCARRPSARSRRSWPIAASTRRSRWPTPDYGLGANVYTQRPGAIAAPRAHAGTVWINDPLTDNDAGPFGGMKRSGSGRELGEEGLDAFQETKHVHIGTELEVRDVQEPYGSDPADLGWKPIGDLPRSAGRRRVEPWRSSKKVIFL